MSSATKFLNFIPRALSSKPSIFIFIVLFIYLVGFGVVGLVFSSLEPSARMQLILGNYTNVTSAAGASIAAGAGVATLKHVRKNSKKYEELKRSHDEMRKLVNEIHRHTVGVVEKTTK
jgi:glutamate-1-semialdehyde aminotransferase